MMAAQILAFPHEHDSAVGIPVLRGALALANTAHPRVPEKAPGPMLIYARPRTAKRRADMSQAEHLNVLLENEIAQRVQREAAERHAGRRITLVSRRKTVSTVPAQATEVRFRERVLDALFFFTRPR